MSTSVAFSLILSIIALFSPLTLIQHGLIRSLHVHIFTQSNRCSSGAHVGIPGQVWGILKPASTSLCEKCNVNLDVVKVKVAYK